MTIPTPELQRRVREASERLAVAERELGIAMAELSGSEGADTMFVTERLRAAFSELASAKAALAVILEPYPPEPSQDA